MAKVCNKEECTWPQFGGGFCPRHQYLRTDKKPKAVRTFSKKRTIVNVDYSKQSKTFIQEHPYCELHVAGVCTRRTQGVHHVKGKSTIALLMNKKYWMGACNPCNDWVEANTGQAKEMGLKKSKHNDH